jgi:hypothetical protein
MEMAWMMYVDDDADDDVHDDSDDDVDDDDVDDNAIMISSLVNTKDDHHR